MALLAKRQERIDDLEAQNAWLKHQLFGRKSERLQLKDPNQLELFETSSQKGDTNAGSDGDSDESSEELVKRRRGGKRSRPSGDLPIIERIYDLPEDQRQSMSVMGSQVSYMTTAPTTPLWVKAQAMAWSASAVGLTCGDILETRCTTRPHWPKPRSGGSLDFTTSSVRSRTSTTRPGWRCVVKRPNR